MSLESKDWDHPDNPPETKTELLRKVKYSYKRDFLLSLSELDVCKKLPSGFDQSVISEFEDASQDRQRNVGGLSLNSFKRNDHGSSPPSKGDLSSYSKGVHGRWESRSSGRSDKDNESQSSWDSAESGRQYGNQSRRFWQSPEHDGLLGSGSFPRTSGFSTGASALKVCAEDQYQLNKTSEPYHPPRPYKAVPHSRRDNNDSYNNETFGFFESTSEDKVEEEKKRRASFEMMRKEQHKAYQQNQNLNDVKHEDELNVSILSEDSIYEKKSSGRVSEPDDIEKSSLPSQTVAVRPLVPPGFTNTILGRNSGIKTLVHSQLPEVEKSTLEEKLLQSKVDDISNGKLNYLRDNQPADQMDLSTKQFVKTGTLGSSNKNAGEILNLSQALDGNKSGINSQPRDTSLDFFDGSEKIIDNTGAGCPNKGHSSSIVTHFSHAITIDDGSSTNLIECDDAKGVYSSIPQNAQSSKFAQWFLEEEKIPASDLSVNKPNDLLSLIVGDEKSRHGVSFSSSKTAEKQMSSSRISTPDVMSELLPENSKAGTFPAVLTCEDLEQSILSEISESGPISLPLRNCWRLPDADAEQSKSNIDDHASQHLLSLLQKEVGEKSRRLSSNMDIVGKNKLQGIEETSVSTNNSREGKADTMSNPGETLTLQTLFGTAFMRELQSVGAPVSVQTGLGGSGMVESRGLSLPVIDDGLLSCANGSGSHTNSHESKFLNSNQRHQDKSDIIGRKRSSFNDSQMEIDSSRLQTGLGSKSGVFHERAAMELPVEDSLVAASHPANLRHFSSGHSSKTQIPFPANAQVDLAEKLMAVNSLSKDETSIMGGQRGSFFHGPYDMREAEIPYQKLNDLSSSPQFHSPQMDNMGLFHSSESHMANMNSHMKFMMPESTINHNLLPSRQIAANMLHPHFLHPNAEVAGFDPSSHNPILSQFNTSGNFPPHFLQGLSRGATLPPFASHATPQPPHMNRDISLPQTNNQFPGFAQELTTRQGFRIGQQQPNFGVLGSAADVGGGSNHLIPEAAQRLLQMELRSNPNKNNLYGGGGRGHGHSQGMFGNELDNFGYR